MAITKPPVLPVWADDVSTSPDLVQPTNEQIAAGWLESTTPPSRGRFNWLFKSLTNAVRYFSRRGIVDYDADETYMTGDIVRGNNGALYRSLQDSNTNHTPSSSPAWWGSVIAPTPPVDDNTTKVATTAYVLGQVSTTTPVMDGAGAIGVSMKFARADHVHPSDSSKANTSGSYPGLSVGSAATAALVPWAGVSARPNTVAGYGIIDAITTANIGVQSVAFANSAGNAYPRRWDGQPIQIIWSGQGGQPNWLLGGNDGVQFHVYNPANFSVNFASSAGSAVSAQTATTQPANASNTTIATTAFANPGASFPGASGYAITSSSDSSGRRLVIQAGSAVSGFVSFPIAFPTAFLGGGCSTNRAFAGSGGYNHISSPTRFGMNVLFDPNPNSGWWWAIGY